MMGLRARLLTTVVLTVVPFGLLVVLAQHLLFRSLHAQHMAEATLARFDAATLAACEADPFAFGRGPGRGHRFHRGPPPHDHLFVYDASFAPARPDQPIVPAQVREALSEGAESAWTRLDRPHDGLAIAVRTGSADACAFVMAVVPAAAPPIPFVLVPTFLIALFCIALVAWASGPLVGRVRRITSSLEQGGDIPVEGADELSALARALVHDRTIQAEQLDALRAREAALTRFVAHTTHDVMIPLNVLSNHLLSMEPSPEVGSALAEAHYIGSLLSNLSAAAKLDALEQPLERGEVDLSDLVLRVVQRHRTLAAQRGISIEYATPEHVLVQADSTLVERALSNIVHNAVRYGRPSGHIAVVLEASGDDFELSVLDDGPGVPKTELSKLGREGRFRDEARTRRGGSGLGLAIAREVADRHGWSLTFEPNEPTGLRASLRSSASG
jgi:two-component system, OmpR family, sensor histidine kinase BaeS